MDPVYLALLIGMGAYFLNVGLRPGGLAGRLEALRRGTTVGFVLVLGTAVTARYLIFVSDKSYFLLPDVLMMLISLTLFRKIEAIFPQLQPKR